MNDVPQRTNCPKCDNMLVHDMNNVFDRCLNCGWYAKRGVLFESCPPTRFEFGPSPVVWKSAQELRKDAGSEKGLM